MIPREAPIRRYREALALTARGFQEMLEARGYTTIGLWRDDDGRWHGEASNNLLDPGIEVVAEDCGGALVALVEAMG